MATLPTAFQISADILSRNERADDIARLKSMMDLPELGYVDVSAHMELLQAFERWPLLAHLKMQSRPPRPDAQQSLEAAP